MYGSTALGLFFYIGIGISESEKYQYRSTICIGIGGFGRFKTIGIGIGFQISAKPISVYIYLQTPLATIYLPSLITLRLIPNHKLRLRLQSFPELLARTANAKFLENQLFHLIN